MDTSNQEDKEFHLDPKVDYSSEIYALRFFPVIEDEDHKGFHQVRLNRVQWKEFSDLMAKFFCTGEGETQVCKMEISDEKIPGESFEKMRDWYIEP